MLSSFVYILQNVSKNFIYVGSTNDLNRRMSEHEKGLVQSTKAYRPLVLMAYVALSSEKKGRELEKYRIQLEDSHSPIGDQT
jgi:putative endonuclease